MAYYAWSEIQVGEPSDGESPGKVTMVKFGDTVTKEKLNADDAQFEAYIRSGAVRQMKPPDMPEEFQGSPRDFMLQQAQEQDELFLGTELNFGEERAVVEEGAAKKEEAKKA